MRTEKEIIKKRDFILGLISNEDIKTEVVMSGKQRMNMRIKVNILNWVLNEEEANI